jgi:hypothetical protein
LIDALSVILDQVGPADVVVSSWTAADAHLEEAAGMIESMNILSFRMIVDRSFRGRQPGYYDHMTRLFGPECIRAIRSHAKFMVISNENWKIVVRTSMNLNENPRFENIEISEDGEFVKFMLEIVDAIFREVLPDMDASKEPVLEGLDAKFPFVKSTQIKMEDLDVPKRRTLSDFILLASKGCGPSTPHRVTEILGAQQMVVADAQARIKDEGLVVRNLKGDVIAHPSIKIMNEAQKIELGLLTRYGKPK